MASGLHALATRTCQTRSLCSGAQLLLHNYKLQGCGSRRGYRAWDLSKFTIIARRVVFDLRVVWCSCNFGRWPTVETSRQGLGVLCTQHLQTGTSCGNNKALEASPELPRLFGSHIKETLDMLAGPAPCRRKFLSQNTAFQFRAAGTSNESYSQILCQKPRLVQKYPNKINPWGRSKTLLLAVRRIARKQHWV